MRLTTTNVLAISGIIFLSLSYTIQAETLAETVLSFLKKNDDKNSNTCQPVLYYDDLCTNFCDDFFHKCRDANLFDGGYDGCIDACARFPRTNSRIDYRNTHGDTYECRRLHVNLALPKVWGSDVAFHCLHATEDGGGVCSDVKLNGETTYRTLHKNLCDIKYIGYCSLFAEDTIANCTNARITDGTISGMLQMLPSSVEILFMTDNTHISALPDGVFENLKSPSTLKALYLDSCNIDTVSEDSFRSLSSLEILSLNGNKLSAFPSDLLDNTPELRQFSYYAAYTTTKLTALPATLFRKTPKMESFLVSDHQIPSIPVGFFQGLSKLEIIGFVGNLLTTSGIPDDLFKDTKSLKQIHIFNNKITEVRSEWFSFENEINRIFLFLNNIETLSANTFSNLKKLKYLYLHENPIDFFSDDFMKENEELIHLTLGAGY